MKFLVALVILSLFNYGIDAAPASKIRLMKRIQFPPAAASKSIYSTSAMKGIGIQFPPAAASKSIYSTSAMKGINKPAAESKGMAIKQGVIKGMAIKQGVIKGMVSKSEVSPASKSLKTAEDNCPLGEIYVHSDGCNTCLCNPDNGVVSCTRRGCEIRVRPDEV